MTAEQLQLIKKMSNKDFELKYCGMLLKGQITKKQYEYLKNLRPKDFADFVNNIDDLTQKAINQM
jgi:hypothetical protein